MARRSFGLATTNNHCSCGVWIGQHCGLCDHRYQLRQRWGRRCCADTESSSGACFGYSWGASASTGRCDWKRDRSGSWTSARTRSVLPTTCHRCDASACLTCLDSPRQRLGRRGCSGFHPRRPRGSRPRLSITLSMLPQRSVPCWGSVSGADPGRRSRSRMDAPWRGSGHRPAGHCPHRRRAATAEPRRTAGTAADGWCMTRGRPAAPPPTDRRDRGGRGGGVGGGRARSGQLATTHTWSRPGTRRGVAALQWQLPWPLSVKVLPGSGTKRQS